MPRFVVAPAIVRGERVDLDDATVRHIRARRIRAGDRVILTDGAGEQRDAVLVEGEAGRIAVRLTDIPVVDRESSLAVHLGICLVQRDRLEWIVEKGTELGVGRFTLIASERSQGGLRNVRVERLERIASAAVEQSQRRQLPQIEGPLPFGVALDTMAAADIRLLYWEASGDSGRDPVADDARPRSVAVLIGPEGGFTADEAAVAVSRGWRRERLGPRILRAETAAVAALALVQSRWGDLDHPARS